MRTIKMIRSEVGYALRAPLAAYGRMLLPENRRYQLMLRAPGTGISVTLYSGDTKPRYRNLFTLQLLLGLPFALVVYAFVLMFAILSVLIVFYANCLFSETFINSTLERVSGYISLLLSLTGLFAIFYWIFT